MARLGINVGSSPNDGSGDSLRDAFTKTNTNFIEVYSDISTIESNFNNVQSSVSDAATNANTALNAANALQNTVNNLSDVAFSGNYGDLSNLPSIPTDVSDLTDTTNLLGLSESDILALGFVQNTDISGTVGGPLVPDTNGAYDLGSSSNRFDTIWLTGAFKIGNTTVEVGDDGIGLKTDSILETPYALAGFVDTENQYVVVTLPFTDLNTFAATGVSTSTFGPFDPSEPPVPLANITGEPIIPAANLPQFSYQFDADGYVVSISVADTGLYADLNQFGGGLPLIFGPQPTTLIDLEIDESIDPLGIFLNPVNQNRSFTASGVINGVPITVNYFVAPNGLPIYSSSNISVAAPFPAALFKEFGVLESDPTTLVELPVTNVVGGSIYFPPRVIINGQTPTRANSSATTFITPVSQQLISTLQIAWGATAAFQLPVYQTATLPPSNLSAFGNIVTVTDGDGGDACLAVYDGSDWRRVPFGLPVNPLV